MNEVSGSILGFICQPRTLSLESVAILTTSSPIYDFFQPPASPDRKRVRFHWGRVSTSVFPATASHPTFYFALASKTPFSATGATIHIRHPPLFGLFSLLSTSAQPVRSVHPNLSSIPNSGLRSLLQSLATKKTRLVYLLEPQSIAYPF